MKSFWSTSSIFVRYSKSIRLSIKEITALLPKVSLTNSSKIVSLRSQHQYIKDLFAFSLLDINIHIYSHSFPDIIECVIWWWRWFHGDMQGFGPIWQQINTIWNARSEAQRIAGGWLEWRYDTGNGERVRSVCSVGRARINYHGKTHWIQVLLRITLGAHTSKWESKLRRRRRVPRRPRQAEGRNGEHLLNIAAVD